MPEIRITADLAELSTFAAQEFIHAVAEGVRQRGYASVALAGGSTPRRLYSLLGGSPFRDQVDWQKLHLFWGDERCVPPDDPESNYKMAADALLDGIPISTGNIHRVKGELPPAEAVLDYRKQLLGFFGKGLPVFDLILLGLGTDGHTASLFPGIPALQEKAQPVMYVPHTNPPVPLVDRISLTLPVLNAARNVLFLVSGAEKAERVAQILNKQPAGEVLPAGMVDPNSGKLIWLLDQAAAMGLKQ